MVCQGRRACRDSNGVWAIPSSIPDVRRDRPRAVLGSSVDVSRSDGVPHPWLETSTASSYAAWCSYPRAHLVDSLHCVSEKRANFGKHGMILIILSKQHQHTFRNAHSTFLFSTLLLTLFVFLNSGDGNEAKHKAFSSVDHWWLWKEPVLV